MCEVTLTWPETNVQTSASADAPVLSPLRSRGWLDRIARLCRMELRGLLAEQRAATPARDRRRILMYSLIPWRPGCVEHMLAAALRLRGHEVATMLCGGMLPDCEMHYYDFDRPACAQCRSRARRFARAFGIAPEFSSAYQREADLAEAERRVHGLDEAGLETLVLEGVPVGRIARFEMHVFYQSYLPALDEVQLGQFRTFCRSAILLTRLAGRLLDHHRPDVAVACNGKGLTYRPFVILARQRGIPVVTWEEYLTDTMRFVFAHNAYANEIHLESVWERERQRPLTPAQEQWVDDCFGQWQRGENTPFPYQRHTRRDADLMHRTLGIPAGVPIVACFPNLVRDSAVLERDVGFGSLLDCLVRTAEFTRGRPDVHLVIRAHPAELCLPEHLAKYNRFFVCPEVRRRCSPLPPNVHLLEGDTAVNSYDLIDAADVLLVYTSTIGLEAALRGRLACIVGDVHYREKGFTRDIARPEELWDFLASGPPYPRTISPEQVTLARRYAYLWRYRHLVQMPWYDPVSMSLGLPTFRELASGGNRVIDGLCRCIVTGEPFLDLEHDAEGPPGEVGS